MSWALGAKLLLISAGAALVALVALVLLHRRLRSRGSVFLDQDQGTVFLFDGRHLVDATDSARALLAANRVAGGPWRQLLAFLGARFADFESRITNLPADGQFSMRSTEGEPLTVIAEWRGGLQRISLVDSHGESRGRELDTLAQRARGEELEMLRHVVDHAPVPMWRETADGTVVWANSSYLGLAARMQPEDEAAVDWPLPRLITHDDASHRRMRLCPPEDSEALWFEVRAVAAAEHRIHYALPADRLVQAEESLRSFVQTLTKTFAQLPIGLAIFDRDRKLQLFNPALTDLTTLPVDFLSSRPGLFSFLDAMRDRRMIPEPKDYKGWRRQMAVLEKSAESGDFDETWALPSGLTYRVSGRPHPEGALAFLFEDISDEVARTRRYRADLELGQSVIDAMDEAIAVFSAGGLLVMSNTAYLELWGHDPGATLVATALSDITGAWQGQTAADPIWVRAESFISGADPREPWSATARMLDGRALRCRFVRLAGGATLAGFRIAGQDAAQPRPETAGSRLTA